MTAPNTALATLEPQTLMEAEQFAKRLSESSLMPNTLRGKPADVLVVMLTGRELGVSPLTALRAIHVVQGRPVLDAALMVALVKKSPVCSYFQLIESTPTRATYETQRKGDPKPTRMTYTIEEAKAAKLTGKDNWTNHPAAMLRARASSALARAVYPDLVLNVLDEDEAEDLAQREPARVSVQVVQPDATDAEIVPDEPTEQQAIEGFGQLIAAVGTEDELKQIGTQIRQATKAVRDAVRPMYEARLEEIKAAAEREDAA